MPGTAPEWSDRLASLVRRHPRLVPPLEVTRLTWRVSGLAPALDGYTIAQISDIHVGEGAWRSMRMRETAATLQAEVPDLVVNTGDFLHHEPPVSKVVAEFEPLLRASGSAEHVAVLGNHDYAAGDDQVRWLKGWLRDLGVRLLVNETHTIVRGDAALTLAGFTLEEPGLEPAARAFVAAPGPRVALVHEPEVAERLPVGGATLVFAGHTHGGQITLPLLERAIVKRFSGSRYVEGLYQIAGNPVYINRGLGCTGVPWRFRARPELTIVRLRR